MVFGAFLLYFKVLKETVLSSTTASSIKLRNNNSEVQTLLQNFTYNKNSGKYNKMYADYPSLQMQFCEFFPNELNPHSQKLWNDDSIVTDVS